MININLDSKFQILQLMKYGLMNSIFFMLSKNIHAGFILKHRNGSGYRITDPDPQHSSLDNGPRRNIKINPAEKVWMAASPLLLVGGGGERRLYRG